MMNEVLELMLLDYATGALSQAESVMIATYMSLNPRARQSVRRYETLGAVMIETLPPTAVSAACLDKTLAAIEALERQETPARRTHALTPEEEMARLPAQLLASLARGDIPPELAWAHMLKGIERCHLLSAAKARQRQQLDLLRLLPGIDMPRPRRRTEIEITLVIQGAYEDTHGFHRRGDMAIITPKTDSQACREQGCLTLTLTTAPLSFEDRLRQILDDFLR